MSFFKPSSTPTLKSSHTFPQGSTSPKSQRRLSISENYAEQHLKPLEAYGITTKEEVLEKFKEITTLKENFKYFELFEEKFEKTPVDQYRNLLKFFGEIPQTLRPMDVRPLFFDIFNQLEKVTKPNESEQLFLFGFGKSENKTVQKNLLYKMPNNIGRFKNLIDLDLSFNAVETLPPSLFSLTQLKRLHLTQNLFKTLPDQLKTLQTLEELYLGKNQFSEIPAVIFELQNLNILMCDRNPLKVPPNIESLKRLQKLEQLILPEALANESEWLKKATAECSNLKIIFN